MVFKLCFRAVEEQTDTNNLQSDYRKFRVVIRGVKEQEGSPKEADKAEKQFLVEKISMEEDDILNTLQVRGILIRVAYL